MVQGTSSHAGKSTFVAALCRILKQEGYRVAPFKSQNMSLNSAITADGFEIGRAQMLQAQAAGIVATPDMNPVLLKPQGEKDSQVVVLGKSTEVHDVRSYYSDSMRSLLWPQVTAALSRLTAANDIVVIEGAGSPAEINLQERDIANMKVAVHAQSPVILVGDIERGGVFASLYGTVELLTPEEKSLVKGFVINKFRGDPSLLEPGPQMLEDRTGIPTLGILPYFRDINLPEEDSLGSSPNLDLSSGSESQLEIAIIRFPQIANSDDFDPLRKDPRLRVKLVSTGSLASADLIILPGSETPISDLRWLHDSGMGQQIINAHNNGIPVVGIGGGAQMLGARIVVRTSGSDINDSHNGSQYNDSHGGYLQALNLMNYSVQEPEQRFARHISTSIKIDSWDHATDHILTACEGMPIEGYEIDPVLPFPFAVEKWVLATTVHGLFHNPVFTAQFLKNVARKRGVTLKEPAFSRSSIDSELDKLAAFVRSNIDIDRLLEVVFQPVTCSSTLPLPDAPTHAGAHSGTRP